MRESRTLCAVARKACGRSKFSGENNGVNSAWYLILEAIDEASGEKELREVVASKRKNNHNKTCKHEMEEYSTNFFFSIFFYIY